MKRALFITEFRRAFLPTLIAVMGIFGALLVLERFMVLQGAEPSDVQGIIDGILAALALLSAFAVGASAFSSELKGKLLFLLQTLPVSRSLVWAVLVSSRLIAHLLTLALVVAFRPSLLQPARLGDLPEQQVLFLISVYLALFSTGCCFAVLIGRALAVYIVGGIVGFLVLPEVMRMSFQPRVMVKAASVGRPFDAANFQENFLAAPSDWRFMGLVLFVLAGVYLVLSARFFVASDFSLIRSSLRNGGLVAVTLLVFLAGVALTVESGVPALGDSWRIEDVFVSNDGRYVGVSERRSNHPWYSRLAIVNVQEGSVDTLELSGLRSATWTDPPLLIHVVRESSVLSRLGFLGFRLPGSVELMTLSAELEEMNGSTFGWSEVLAVKGRDDGKVLVVRRQNETASLQALDARTHRFEELESVPADGGASILPLGQDHLVWFGNIALDPRAFRVTSGSVHEVDWGRGERRIPSQIVGSSTYVLDDTAMEVQFPFPRDGELADGVVGGYLTSGIQDAVTEANFVFYATWNAEAALAELFTKLFPVLPWIGTSSSRFHERRGRSEAMTLFFYRNLERNRSCGTVVLKVGEGVWRSISDRIWLPVTPASELMFFNLGSQTVFHAPTRFAPLSVGIDPEFGLAVYLKRQESDYLSHLYDANLNTTFELGPVREAAEGRSRIAIGRVPGLDGALINIWPSQLSYLYPDPEGVPRRLQTEAVPTSAYLPFYAYDDGSYIYANYRSGRPVRLHFVSPDGTRRRLWPVETDPQ